jgi:hypothetical protein
MKDSRLPAWTEGREEKKESEEIGSGYGEDRKLPDMDGGIVHTVGRRR